MARPVDCVEDMKRRCNRAMSNNRYGQRARQNFTQRLWLDPDESSAPFSVEIPHNTTGEVLISEHYTWDVRWIEQSDVWRARMGKLGFGAPQMDVHCRRSPRAVQLAACAAMGASPAPGAASTPCAATWARNGLADPGHRRRRPRLDPQRDCHWNGLEPRTLVAYTQTAAATGHGVNHKGTAGKPRATR